MLLANTTVAPAIVYPNQLGEIIQANALHFEWKETVSITLDVLNGDNLEIVVSII